MTPASLRSFSGGPALSSQAAGIELSQRVAAPIDQLWRACASANGLMNWQADQVSGEPRLGGKLTLSWLAFERSIELQVVEIVPYERIVLQHGPSVVELALSDELVTLRHHGPETAEDAEGLRSSWQQALAQLAHSVERHPGRQRRVRWLVRPMACSAEAAHLCFTEPLLLRRWLTDLGGISTTAADYSLLLKNGTQLSGRVLAAVLGRDVTVTCDAFGEAVLSLRTLPAPEGGRWVAMALSEWGRPRSATSELCQEFGHAMSRLALMLDDCPSA
jgi:uncharacterized protein YndB with AHSA1/START domain